MMPEAKNVPTSGRFYGSGHPPVIAESLEGEIAKLAVHECAGAGAVSVVSIVPPIADCPGDSSLDTHQDTANVLPLGFGKILRRNPAGPRQRAGAVQEPGADL